MTKVEMDGEEEGVILKDPSSKRKNQLIHWFFTFNNYNGDDIKILLKFFKETCFMFAFQEETGENGTPHLQGVISLKKRARWSEFGLQKNIHWEKPINVKDCYIYCTKNETRTGDVFLLNYEIPYTFKLDKLYDWQSEIVSILNQTPDDRTIHWFWSEKGGIGKSNFVKHIVCNFNAVLLTKGKYADICNLIFKANMTANRVVVFDLPRNNGNKISYDALESIKNGMIVNMKYETGFIVFPSPHIIVFANEPPEKENLSNDRWHIVELDG